MQKRIFHIESNDAVARDTFRIVLRTDAPVAVRSGQFVDLALPEFYLRRPISISDCRPDAVVLFYKTVGEGTRALSKMTQLLVCGARAMMYFPGIGKFSSVLHPMRR